MWLLPVTGRGCLMLQDVVVLNDVAVACYRTWLSYVIGRGRLLLHVVVVCYRMWSSATKRGFCLLQDVVVAS